MGQSGPVEVSADEAAGSRGRRVAFLVAGHALIALGVIGAFLPVMPTTVFLILAASCYARSSARLHRKLLEHPRFGPALRDWRDHRAMSRRAKAIAIGTILVSFAWSFFLIPLGWIRAVHVTIGVALVAYLLRIRTRPPA